jgi:carboxypeptidase family protein/TonB-dependent receptor-like protein
VTILAVFRHLSVVVCLATLFATALLAQTTGTIAGSVTDTTGGVVGGVTLMARHLETGLTRTTASADDGRFAFTVLPVGAYEIAAAAANFKPLTLAGITLTVNQTVVVTVVMQVGAVAEQVNVIGTPPPVNTRTSELSYLVGERAIEQLPLNGRNYTDLALLQPGVNPFPHRDGGSVVAHGLAMSINGQDPRANVYLLDGTLQNDFTNGPAGSAAGTTLGMETIREFRVESNAYQAEFGRNFGGQINVLTKSGTNRLRGSAFEFHRNDALDARNYFDTGTKPDFRRNQFGAAIGGPFQANRTFFFFAHEALIERVGRTISTVVPDDGARAGILPTGAVGVRDAVGPYLQAFPRANGPLIGGGLAQFTFPFQQTLTQHFGQGRIDRHFAGGHQLFARHTLDDATQFLPTDFPQFPREFISRNQFFTSEYRRVLSARTLSTWRFGYSRTRVGQNVEANLESPLPPFVSGRASMGGIVIGGIPSFGPQTSANLRLAQTVLSGQWDMTHAWGAHLFKMGALVERYRDDMFNPTFSLGIYRFANLGSFLAGTPASFVGLTPDADMNRNWTFTLLGAYAQDAYQVAPHLTVNGGVRYELATVPEERQGRDVALVTLADTLPTIGPLYRNPTLKNLSPRAGIAWDVRGDNRTAVRAGYGLYFNTNNQQNLIVTVTNPPFAPRPVFVNPPFPSPPYDRPFINSIRPIQYDFELPRLHMWNVSVQHNLGWQTVVTAGYAGSRGRHLLRSNDVNVATPQIRADGTLFIPVGTPRANPAFTTIELKSSDGDSWYKALLVEVRKEWSSAITLQSSYTLSRAEDTTQASTFFSDSTNGTTTAFPEFVAGYNKGLSDFHIAHNWVLNFTWQVPFAADRSGLAAAVFKRWQVSGITTMRSGSPLTVFVQGNRSRSQWLPSLAPGVGQDRPSYAPGYGPHTAVLGRPDQWFDPAAFRLQDAGTFGDTGRGDFIGPNLRTVDLAFVKSSRGFNDGGTVDLRVEVFNVLNRANFGPPALIAFAGNADNETPLPSLGRIRTTVTSARQVQLGVRITF